MENNLSQLNKKIVAIAGGAGYLGQAITKKLIAEDFIVVIVDRHQPKDFTAHEQLFFLTADVADEQSAQDLAANIQSDFGRLDFFIYAVSAPLARQKVLSQTAEAFTGQFAANVFGAFNLAKYLTPLMGAGGAIIGLTSQAVESGSVIAPSGSYVPAKYALRGLLRVLAGELSNQVIRVCAVSPAFMPGGLNSDLPEPVREFIQKKSQPEKSTSPAEVAQVIVDVLQDKIKNINGKSIAVPSCLITDL